VEDFVFPENQDLQKHDGNSKELERESQTGTAQAGGIHPRGKKKKHKKIVL